MDKLVKLYIDCPAWGEPVRVDDFLVAIGKLKSNSVYHVAEVRAVPRPKKRAVRYYVKVYKSTLSVALARDPGQSLITLHWYARNKKKPLANC